MGRKKHPELRKKIRKYLETLKEVKGQFGTGYEGRMGKPTLVCSDCGGTLLSHKMIRHKCPDCGKRSMIDAIVSSIYSSYLNGKCKWLDEAVPECKCKGFYIPPDCPMHGPTMKEE